MGSKPTALANQWPPVPGLVGLTAFNHQPIANYYTSCRLTDSCGRLTLHRYFAVSDQRPLRTTGDTAVYKIHEETNNRLRLAQWPHFPYIV